MPDLLPLIPTLRNFAGAVTPTLLDERDAAGDELDDRKAAITTALLGDAVLVPADLPGAWALDAPASRERSLFGSSVYHALFIAEMRVRLRRAETNEHLEQHIGVLPRWAIRHFADELDSAVTHGVSYPQPNRSSLTMLHMPGTAEQKFALRMARADEGRPLSTDAVYLRRGALVMALAYWQGDGGVSHAATTTSLALLADLKWAETADALR